MKAKRTLAAFAAAVIAVSAVSAHAFAIDYAIKANGNNNNFTGTAPAPGASGTSPSLVTTIVTEVEDNIIDAKTVRDAVTNDTSIRIPYDGATINRGGVAQIAKSDKPVKLTTTDGAVITIDPTSVSDVSSQKLKFRIVSAPEEGAVYIYPEGTGAYGFSLDILVPANKIPDTMDKETAHIYHITDNGIEDQGAVSFNSTGSCSVTIKGRSYYKIVGSAAMEDVSAAAGLNADGTAID